jgi:hypothetical protein
MVQEAKSICDCLQEEKRERLVCTLQCNPYSEPAIGGFHRGMTFTIGALLYVFK